MVIRVGYWIGAEKSIESQLADLVRGNHGGVPWVAGRWEGERDGALFRLLAPWRHQLLGGELQFHAAVVCEAETPERLSPEMLEVVAGYCASLEIHLVAPETGGQ